MDKKVKEEKPKEEEVPQVESADTIPDPDKPKK